MRPRVLLLLMLCGGCGRAETGIIHGVVHFEGQPLSSGVCAVRGASGRVDQANIGADGSYVMRAAPLGAVELSVQTFPPGLAVVPPGAEPKKREPPPVHVRIPERYADFRTSGLRCTVKPGDQKLDLELVK